MPIKRLINLFVVFVLVLATAPLAAQESSDTQVIASIDRTLVQIVDLLRVQVRGQETSTLTRLLEIEATRLAPIERALNEAKPKHDALLSELGHIARSLEALEDLGHGADERTQAGVKQETQRQRMQEARLKDQTWRLEQQISELQADRDRRRADYDSLKEQIDLAPGRAPSHR